VVADLKKPVCTIEPTILDEVSLDAQVMKSEIFGPILPIIGFSTRKQALEIIQTHKNP
jgi:acyl-CoA reductase-like NAD-dependent aldehyde dehydrogenase